MRCGSSKDSIKRLNGRLSVISDVGDGISGICLDRYEVRPNAYEPMVSDLQGK